MSRDMSEDDLTEIEEGLKNGPATPEEVKALVAEVRRLKGIRAPRKEEFIPFHRPSVYPKHIEAVTKVLESGWLTTASVCEQFEQEFLKHVGGKYAVAVSSCTAAIQLALSFLRKGNAIEEVVTSPITFVSAVNVIEQLGMRPVFADVRNSDLTIDPESVHRQINSRTTKAIIATNLAGIPPQVAALHKLSVQFDVPLIVDSAHGIEARYNGCPSGDFGWANCYSFYATKNITCGEGGMLVTNDENLANFARRMRLHGMDKDAWKRYGPEGYKHWDVARPGWKMNLSDINAALGLAQLAEMDSWRATRGMLHDFYIREFEREDRVRFLEIPDEAASAYHLMVIRVKNRDQVMKLVQEQGGVGVGIHFRGVHTLKFWQGRDDYSHLPVATKASDEILSIPLYPGLTIQQANRVIAVVKEALDDAGC